MDWDKLRVFHAVAEAGSFTHAGDTLNLSQSAVSRQISALEEDRFEQIGVPVFVKGYVRQCAQRLGLDPHKLMQFFRAVYSSG